MRRPERAMQEVTELQEVKQVWRMLSMAIEESIETYHDSYTLRQMIQE